MAELVTQNLKKLRELSGFTQREVALALGIERSAYANYESGTREMPIDVLEGVCDFLGCEMHLLFQEDVSEDMLLVSAFRVDDLAEEDLQAILDFKDIVKSYIKMDKMLKAYENE